jgi:hypothetical protein
VNSGQTILSTFVPGDECTGEGAHSSTIADCAADCTGEGARTSTHEESFRIDVGRDPDLWLYRERTIALLKRYLRISIEVGRLPSLLGRDCSAPR